MAGVVINGVEVFGPAGCGLPVVADEGKSATAFSGIVVAPPEFAPSPPVIPSPVAPLQPHPDYPVTYPPVAQGRPTETGPKKVFYQKQDSGQILTTAPSGDMQANEFATNGEWGVVDWAQRANVAANVAWDGITEMPSRIGTYWWVGSGPPGNIPAAHPGDLYLDETTGDVYQLT
jgi:hypothetical protein